jgi:hypothetical protein
MENAPGGPLATELLYTIYKTGFSVDRASKMPVTVSKARQNAVPAVARADARPAGPAAAQTSRLATDSALRSMNSRRGST